MSISEFKLPPKNPSGIAGPAEKMRAALNQAMEMLPLEAEAAVMLAKVRREKFKAYVREGFTESQAIELLKAEIR